MAEGKWPIRSKTNWIGCFFCLTSLFPLHEQGQQGKLNSSWADCQFTSPQQRSLFHQSKGSEWALTWPHMATGTRECTRSKYRVMKHMLYLGETRLRIPEILLHWQFLGKWDLAEYSPSRRAQWHKRSCTMQWWYTAKAFMFKSIFHVAKGEEGQHIHLLPPGQTLQLNVLKTRQEKKHACESVHSISPRLLGQLSLQLLNQQNSNPSPFPRAMKFLPSIPCINSQGWAFTAGPKSFCDPQFNCFVRLITPNIAFSSLQWSQFTQNAKNILYLLPINVKGFRFPQCSSQENISIGKNAELIGVLYYLQTAESFWQDGGQSITGTRLKSCMLRILESTRQRAIQHHSPESYNLRTRQTGLPI